MTTNKIFNISIPKINSLTKPLEY